MRAVKFINPIRNWRQCWRFRSVQAGLGITALQAIDTVNSVLPMAEQSPLLDSIVEQPAYQWLKLLLAVAILVLRLVDQNAQKAGERDDR